jgi:hypothetical protein
MKKVIRLTESDLTRIIKRIIKEDSLNGSFGDLEFVKEDEKDNGSVVTKFAKRMNGYEVVAYILKYGDSYFGKVGVTVDGDGDGTIWLTNSHKNNVNGFIKMNGPNDPDFIREFVERSHKYGRAKYEYLNIEPLR